MAQPTERYSWSLKLLGNGSTLVNYFACDDDYADAGNAQHAWKETT